eukprot:TRINITY_DN1487_c1_g1_i1.p1 TRINITY_DN1487_c1_g1~~TRINITY_DN1487_c1_g1_i1.p1  ORF type:complete len:168 (-),score=30.96 TRINITY_DN1487_c1_g1_i1:453-887(-)
MEGEEMDFLGPFRRLPSLDETTELNNMEDEKLRDLALCINEIQYQDWSRFLTRITVDNPHLNEDGKTIEYDVRISYRKYGQEHSYVVSRRYREFLSLYTELQMTWKDKLPPFPEKKYYWKQLSAEVVQVRVREFNDLMKFCTTK